MYFCNENNLLLLVLRIEQSSSWDLLKANDIRQGLLEHLSLPRLCNTEREGQQLSVIERHEHDARDRSRIFLSTAV